MKYTIEIIKRKEVRHGMSLEKGTIYARGNGMNVAVRHPKGESFSAYIWNASKDKDRWHKVEISIHYSSLARELVEFAYSHKEMIAALR